MNILLFNNKDTSDVKSIALQNAIIAIVRKRPYISPILFGLAVICIIVMVLDTSLIYFQILVFASLIQRY